MSKGSNYRVGYKKPPPETKFQRGRSGNPKGRPKKNRYDVGAALLEALDCPVTITEDGEKKRVPAREAIVRRSLHEASKGDLGALDDIFRLLNVPGDASGPIYVWAEDWGVPNPEG